MRATDTARGSWFTSSARDGRANDERSPAAPTLAVTAARQASATTNAIARRVRKPGGGPITSFTVTSTCADRLCVDPLRRRVSYTSGVSKSKPVEQLERVVIRFAGDSGDGMQLTGDRFTSETAVFGNDLATLPDFPAEIRAPAGSLPGVSGFQVHFADHDILTPGDQPSVLVAMNQAALKVNLSDLAKGGTVIVNTDAFNERNLQKAGYTSSPLDLSDLHADPFEQFDLWFAQAREAGLLEPNAMTLATVGLRFVASSSPKSAPRNVTSSIRAVETALIRAPGYDQTSGKRRR